MACPLRSNESSEERQRVEHLKLGQLFGFCETTRCRRQVLLGYFGEQLSAECGNCDNCLEPVESWDGTTEAQMALSAVARTGQRFGQGHIIDLLLGNATPQITSWSHDQLPTFGVGEHLDKRTWRSVVRQLVAAGLLTVDVDGYGGLELGREARALMRGEMSIELRRDPKASKKAKRKSQKKGAILLEKPEDQELFEALRQLRLELARRQKVPPYVVFSDRTLIEMAAARPGDNMALREVHGVGDAKLERYGQVFLERIAEHAR
jgi:ATP-dependent DNA helicase RecQ